MQGVLVDLKERVLRLSAKTDMLYEETKKKQKQKKTKAIAIRMSFCMRAGYLSHSCTEIASNQKLVSLQFSLDDYESKIGLGIHVSSHILDMLDLLFYAIVDALEKAI